MGKACLRRKCKTVLSRHDPFISGKYYLAIVEQKEIRVLLEFLIIVINIFYFIYNALLLLYWGLMAKNEFIISPNPNVENTSNCVKQCNFQEQKYATAPFPKSSSCAPQRLIDDHEKPFIWEAKRCLFEQSSVVVCLHRRCRFTIKTKFVTFPRILAWIARLGTYHS